MPYMLSEAPFQHTHISHPISIVQLTRGTHYVEHTDGKMVSGGLAIEIQDYARIVIGTTYQCTHVVHTMCCLLI